MNEIFSSDNSVSVSKKSQPSNTVSSSKTDFSHKKSNIEIQIDQAVLKLMMYKAKIALEPEENIDKISDILRDLLNHL